MIRSLVKCTIKVFVLRAASGSSDVGAFKPHDLAVPLHPARQRFIVGFAQRLKVKDVRRFVSSAMRNLRPKSETKVVLIVLPDDLEALYTLAAEFTTLRTSADAMIRLQIFPCTGQDTIVETGFIIQSFLRYVCLQKFLLGEAGLKIRDDDAILLTDIRDVWFQVWPRRR